MDAAKLLAGKADFFKAMGYAIEQNIFEAAGGGQRGLSTGILRTGFLCRI